MRWEYVVCFLRWVEHVVQGRIRQEGGREGERNLRRPRTSSGETAIDTQIERIGTNELVTILLLLLPLLSLLLLPHHH